MGEEEDEESRAAGRPPASAPPGQSEEGMGGQNARDRRPAQGSYGARRAATRPRSSSSSVIDSFVHGPSFSTMRQSSARGRRDPRDGMVMRESLHFSLLALSKAPLCSLGSSISFLDTS
jgi:hypothetical protein